MKWSAFVKDDYKVTRHLTLNLGLRWEFYASPYIEGGLTSTIIGSGLWRIRRHPDGADDTGQIQQRSICILAASRQFVSDRIRNQSVRGGTDAARTAGRGVQQNALLPVSTCDPNSLSSIQFVGPAVRIRE